MTHVTQAEFAQIKFLVSKQKLPYTAIGSRVYSSPSYSVCGHCTPEEAIFIAMACNIVWGLCEMVDELQARVESAEQSKTEAWMLVDELTVSLQQALEQGERRFNEVAQERDKLRAALDHAESHIQEMENAEGRAFFADTAAMAKQLGDTMQERDTLAERVKALEGAIDYLFSQESLSDSDVREVKRLLKGNANA